MVQGSCKVVYQPAREVIYSTVVEPIMKIELDCGGGFMGRVDFGGGLAAKEGYLRRKVE